MSNCMNCQTCPQLGKRAFCNLNQKSNEFLQTHSVRKEFVRGTRLFSEGDRSDAVFLLCSGKVKLIATSKDGRTMTARIATAGDLLGMSAALTSTDYEVTAEAMEPCRVRVLPLPVLNIMMQQFPDASLAAARALAIDYRTAFDGTRRVTFTGSAAGRLAGLILDWADEARRNSQAFINMPLTHEELASMTATSRETITRTLGRMKKDKIISTRGVALTVLQPMALRQLSAC